MLLVNLRTLIFINSRFLRTNKADRPSHLLRIVKQELQKKRPIIVFGNKSVTSDYISIFLNNNGVNCINLNGDMLHQIRLGRFEQFQNGSVDVLSTTDIGSRGLNTTRVRHVINFDFPIHSADYIHRCGRVGRLGSQSNCFVTNFISSQSEIDLVKQIEYSVRTQSLLKNVDANITNIINKNIEKEIKKYENSM
jgi:superfamily II DNA/RNA helicase